MFGTDITTQLQREVSVGVGRGRGGVESQAEPVPAEIDLILTSTRVARFPWLHRTKAAMPSLALSAHA